MLVVGRQTTEDCYANGGCEWIQHVTSFLTKAGFTMSVHLKGAHPTRCDSCSCPIPFDHYYFVSFAGNIVTCFECVEPLVIEEAPQGGLPPIALEKYRDRGVVL